MMRAHVLAIAVIAVSGAAIVAAPAAPAATARSGGGVAAFAGHWQVTGVAAPDDGVQALVDNDPSYMGKRLTFSQARLAWDRPLPSADATCANPRFTRVDRPAPAGLRAQLRKLGLPRPTTFAISCRSGSWGPGDSIVFRGAGGVLAMPWYDNGLLKLVRR